MSIEFRRNQAINLRQGHYWFGTPIELPRDYKTESEALVHACRNLHGFFQVIFDTCTHEVTPESYCELYEKDFDPSMLRIWLEAWRTGRMAKLKETVNAHG